ncbi:MAG: M4 family metallopeptidase [Salibacteraceae bacterium]
MNNLNALCLSVLSLLFFTNPLNAQLDSNTVDSLLNEYVDIWDSTGIYTFKHQVLSPGELFTIYQDYFIEDEHNELVLEKQWQDYTAKDHYRYRQYFKGVAVQGAVMNELVQDDFVIMANGKVADFNPAESDTSGAFSEEEALYHLGTLYDGWDEDGDYYWAWMDEDWTTELQEETGDPDANYGPYGKGELMWMLTGNREVGYTIPGDRYTLVWRFPLFCLDPYFHRYYYVDAFNGDVVDVEDMGFTDGTLSTFNHGQRDMDTEYKGGLTQKYICKAEDDGHNIHTKRYKKHLGIAIYSNVKDEDNEWGTHEQKTTNAHWASLEAWDYFKDEYSTNGVDGEGLKLKVRANVPILSGVSTSYVPGNSNNSYDIIYFTHRDNNDYGWSIDIAGHEYTHGIIYYTSKLQGIGESGALNESFSDIFGLFVESRTENSSSVDWIVGEDATSDNMYIRSFENPKQFYRHYPNANCDTSEFVLGQPDTYQGEFWESNNCDMGGVHINASVQNHWFYLLTMGGVGTNDNNENYIVQGIGINDARYIAYHTMISLTEYSSFSDARATSLQICVNEWGVCSEQYFECARAWAAVGIGNVIPCNGLLVEDRQPMTSLNIYPNPANNILNVSCNIESTQTLKLYTLGGVLIKEARIVGGSHSLNVSNLASGVYTLALSGQNADLRRKVVIVN